MAKRRSKNRRTKRTEEKFNGLVAQDGAFVFLTLNIFPGTASSELLIFTQLGA